MLHLPDFPVVSRLAPTPSGFLHLGNALNFTLTWLLTRRTGGQLHLRIDDLDRARFRPIYLDNVFRTLDWLGLDYDLGPTGPDDFERHYSQRHFLADYELVLQAAQRANPGLFYACTCSRTQLLAQQTTLGAPYPGTCRSRQFPLTTPEAAWRAAVPPFTVTPVPELGHPDPVPFALGQELGDFVVRKKDGAAAYQVASVVDDTRLGVTFIVRGLDLLPSTAAQLWLAQHIPGQQRFEATQFLHHNLVLNEAGQKLSKSTQAGHRGGIMAEASSPQVVYQAAARALGLPSEASESLAALLQRLG